MKYETDHLKLKFATEPKEFYSSLNKRVTEYFTSSGIQRTADMAMYVKSVIMFLLYFIPYGFILSGEFTSLWALAGLCGAMGLGKAGIGMSVMHDANHGAYFRKSWKNNILGYSLNLIGGHCTNWKIQHNVLHHTYTNIHEVDEDISPRGVLRMAPACQWKPFHRFQHLYAWVLYGLLTLVWIVFKDFSRLGRYSKEKLLARQKSSLGKEWVIVLISKTIYATYIFAIPMMLLPVTFLQVLVGFFIMHYVSGFILAIVFQPAHVVDGTEYPVPDDSGNLENTWAIHQLQTTTNFGHKHRLFSWFVGGLNYQVEHHLFPKICHIHYRKLSPIVRQVAEEHGLPYKSKESFLDALSAHAKIMYDLGRKPTPSMSVA